MIDKEKIKAAVERMMYVRRAALVDSFLTGRQRAEMTSEYELLGKVLDIIDSISKEPVNEDLEKAADNYIKGFHYAIKRITKESFIDGANWQRENIEHKLLTEVLPYFMHGGEADEVVAKLEEVLDIYK